MNVKQFPPSARKSALLMSIELNARVTHSVLNNGNNKFMRKNSSSCVLECVFGPFIKRIMLFIFVEKI
jgi:hypothetical protein